ncbi:MAG: UDP-3-O-[3-hydroxymyristoyl] N-acetylglucosamine deacetylase [Bacteroidetes bacterium]|nr:MAG: UDP-3-O-[3-hydroxymyristoyl] N-acetylglucosamine deacetylase [Bacteroidota bacterium]
MEKQRTIRVPVELKGVGLHTGKKVMLKILPAPENHGYKFQRIDLEDHPIVPADVDLVVDTKRGTTLEYNGVKVHTTEHVLAALFGLMVDNALIQIDGTEIPILDGSSIPFVKAIEKVGYQEQDAVREYFDLKEIVTYEDTVKDVEMLAVPTAGGEFRLTVMVDYHSPVLGTQHASMYTLDEFKTEIASCRTFVFLKELESLAKAGLIKGGDLDNAIVLVEKKQSKKELNDLAKLLGKEDMDIKVEGIGILNTVKLQYENEPARHKLLDIVGDFALIGKYIRGHILAARPGHAGNIEFAKILKKKIQEYKKGVKHIDPSQAPILNVNQIAEILPHRYPILLVDKILEIGDDYIIGSKNVTFNEPFFTGHFPGNPIMPGVLQIEAMAQVGGVLALSMVDEPEKYSTYFLKIDKVRFKQKVVPGDTLVFRLDLLTPIRRGIVQMSGKTYVNNKVVSEAEVMAQIVKEK